MPTKTTTKAKKSTPTSSAVQPDDGRMKPHELVLSPTVQGAAGIQSWSKFMGEADLIGLIKELREAVERVQDGNMKSVEAMLYGQAMTLQTIFTNLARKAQAQDYLKQFQVNLTLALKAQAQCRATLEALAEIKNPRPVLITKQANISGGHQQVNNGVTQTSSQQSTESMSRCGGPGAHARNASGLRNGLLKASHGVELKTPAPSTAGRPDQHPEAVAADRRAAQP